MTSVETAADATPLEYTVRYGERTLQFHLCYLPDQSKPAVRVHVHPNGMVQVDAPENAELSEIKAAVLRRARWIIKHLDGIEERKRHALPRQWVSGESMLYLGRRYVLKVIQEPPKATQNRATCKLVGGQLQVRGKALDKDRIQKLTQQWYRQRSLDVFKRRLEKQVDQLPWMQDMPPWRVMEMQTQWGSCSPSGELILNPNLVKAPTRAIDYVLLHELCHLVEHNHSPRFYGLLDRFMPDWRSVKENLDGRAEQMLGSEHDSLLSNT